MFAGAPNLTFIFGNEHFHENFSHFSGLVEKLEILDFTRLVGVKKHMLLDGNKVHNSHGEILAGG